MIANFKGCFWLGWTWQVGVESFCRYAVFEGEESERCRKLCVTITLHSASFTLRYISLPAQIMCVLYLLSVFFLANNIKVLMVRSVSDMLRLSEVEDFMHLATKYKCIIYSLKHKYRILKNIISDIKLRRESISFYVT